MLDLVKISRESLRAMLEAVVTGYYAIGPVVRQGRYGFAHVTDVDQLAMACDRTVGPVNGVYFPEELTGRPSQTPSDVPIALIALRPTDLQALTLADAYYGEHSGYADRRAKTLVIGMTRPPDRLDQIDEPWQFLDDSRFDLAVTDLGSSLVVHVASNAGRRLIHEVADPQSVDATTKTVFQAFRDYYDVLLSQHRKHNPGEAALRGEPVRAMVTQIQQSCTGCTECFDVCPTNFTPARGEGAEQLLNDNFAPLAAHLDDQTAAAVRQGYRSVLSHYVLAGCVGCGRCVAHCQAGVAVPLVQLLKRVASGQLASAS